MNLMNLNGELINPEQIVSIKHRKDEIHGKVYAIFHFSNGTYIETKYLSLKAFEKEIEALQLSGKTFFFKMLYNCVMTMLKIFNKRGLRCLRKHHRK